MTKAIAISLIVSVSVVAQTDTRKSAPNKAQPASKGARSAAAAPSDASRSAGDLKAFEKALTDELEEAYRALLLRKDLTATPTSQKKLLGAALWEARMLASETEWNHTPVHNPVKIPNTDTAKANKVLELLRLPQRTPKNEERYRQRVNEIRDMVRDWHETCNPNQGQVPEPCIVYPGKLLGGSN